MKLIVILFLSLFVVSCGGGGNKRDDSRQPPATPPQKPYVEVFPEYRTYSKMYGTQDQINKNSWTFTSHKIDYEECERDVTSPCRKTKKLYEYDANHVPGRETKWTFNLTVNDYNMIDPPDWVIIFQDWFDYDPYDFTPTGAQGGNHPFTTLKLIVFGGALRLGAYNNAWQWSYNYFNPIDPTDPSDLEHNHQENELTGSVPLIIGNTYQIEMIIEDGETPADGKVVIFINGHLLSQQLYQTKPTESPRAGVIQFGQYWDREYNGRINGCVEATGELEKDCKSNTVTIANFRVFERNILTQ
jgi:hypothetical protein